MSDSVSLVAAIGVTWLAHRPCAGDRDGSPRPRQLRLAGGRDDLGSTGHRVAIDARRHDEQLRPAPLAPYQPSAFGEGPVDVLVGYDGSSESAAAVEAVVELLGPRLGRLTVAAVVSYGDIPELERIARDKLRSLAGRRSSEARRFEILHGHASVALAHRAAEGGYDLIAVGTRGAGLSRAILGSAASELTRDSKVPVLVVGAPVRQAEGTPIP